MVVASPDFSSPRRLITGFGVGLLLALTTSGGIAGERITRGTLAVALVVNTTMTAAALLAAVFTMRRVRLALARPPGAASPRASRRSALALLVLQVLGAASGILFVHLLLRREALGVLPWLSERPAQLVNDGVAVAGLLALVWASVDDLDARLLFAAFLAVTAYRVTSPMWHLDHAPGGFQNSIQELVVAQFVGAALALGLFRTIVARENR